MEKKEGEQKKIFRGILSELKRLETADPIALRNPKASGSATRDNASNVKESGASHQGDAPGGSIKERWKRPATLAKPIGHRGSLAVMHMDTTYSMSAVGGGAAAIIELHGITKEGASVWINVYNFMPYFIFRTSYENPAEIIGALEAKLKSSLHFDKKLGGQSTYITDWCISDKKSVLGYTEEFSPDPNQEPERGPFAYVKVSFRNPKHVRKARELLESGRIGARHLRCNSTYEANILYDLRFMIDRQVNGCQWFIAKDVREVYADNPARRSRAQIELDVYADDIVPAISEGPFALSKDTIDSIAPIRILSFDIECIPFDGKKGRFPVADLDPVICVSFYTIQQGFPELSCAFSWGEEAAPLPCGAETYIYPDEKCMFGGIARFVRATDPDIITGYNINGFDIPYLMNRAKVIGVYDTDFGELSRKIGKNCFPIPTTFKSRAQGTKKSFSMKMPGRSTFDLLQWMQREKKLRSYTLNAVSELFLGDNKEEVHHSMLYPLFHGTWIDRMTINKYCLKDAKLPLRITMKELIITNSVEMCRTVGVPFCWLTERGQQAKTRSIFMRNAGPAGFCVPTKPPKRTPYTGAIVLRPKPGFYTVPIVVLDFVSLYPSIMQAHNLCYSTFVWLKDAQRLGLRYPEDYVIPPGAEGSHGFVKPHIRRGLLPAILADILTRRKLAKTDMANAKKAGNTQLAEIMDGRQLALKITANSVYGYTSADQLPLTYIAAAVTAYGRDLITFTEAEIKREFGADIIYGDTDSVMINFGDVSIERAMELGKAASNFMKPKYAPPLDCAWEKCYYPFLLQDKKRYAGLFWTKPEKHDKSDYKGIEVVRRDWTLFCTEVLTKGLDCLLNDKNIQGVIDCVHQACDDILNNRVDISKLILSKGFTKPLEEYEATGNQVPVHIQVVKNALKRDAATAPVVGDRVCYVITQGLHKERKTGGRGWGTINIAERAEDPLYVMQNDIPLDAMWYIENQLMGPCIRLFQVPLCVTEEEQKQLKNPEYYEKHPKETVAYKKLFVGKHMMRRICTIKRAEPGKTTSFVVRLPPCLVCHSTAARKKENGLYEATCGAADCLRDADPTPHQTCVAEKETVMKQHQDICVKCQGGDVKYEDILCENRVCKNWYQRFKAQKDYEDAKKILSRFFGD